MSLPDTVYRGDFRCKACDERMTCVYDAAAHSYALGPEHSTYEHIVVEIDTSVPPVFHGPGYSKDHA